MQLHDPKLKFARTLIRHWSRIRGKELVPLEADLDPRELQPVLPDLTIMDLPKPGESMVAVMGKNIRSRYPPDLLDHRNWYDFIPPEGVAASEAAVRPLVEIPCGVYYSYMITDGSKAVETGEALALPMMTHNSDKPTMWISVARIDGAGGLIISPIRLDSLSIEFVDIGAGIPSEATVTAPPTV